jgi:hypothetical protein
MTKTDCIDLSGDHEKYLKKRGKVAARFVTSTTSSCAGKGTLRW